MCLLEDIYRNYTLGKAGVNNPQEQAKVDLATVEQDTGEHTQGVKRSLATATGNDTPDGLIARGDFFASNKDYHKAIECYHRAAEASEAYDVALEREVRLLMDTGRDDHALKVIDSALKKFPDYEQAYIRKAEVLTAQKDLEGALDCYDKALEVNPGNKDVLLGQSELFMQAKQYRKAAISSAKVLTSNPENEQAAMTAAKAFFGMKDYEKSIEFLNRATRINPENKKAQNAKKNSIKMLKSTEKDEFKLGLFLMKNQIYGDAIKNFEKLVQEGDHSSEVYFYLGEAAKGMGDLSAAKSYYLKTIEADSASLGALQNLAEISMAEKDEDLAMSYLDRIIDLDPTNREAYFLKGNHYRAQGMEAEAEKYYDKMIEVNPKDSEAYLLKGIIAMERYPIAGNPLFYFDRAMELNPDYDLPFFYRGKFQVLSGHNPKHALESFNKAAFLASQSRNEALLELCRQEIADLIAKRGEM